MSDDSLVVICTDRDGHLIWEGETVLIDGTTPARVDYMADKPAGTILFLTRRHDGAKVYVPAERVVVPQPASDAARARVEERMFMRPRGALGE